MIEFQIMMTCNSVPKDSFFFISKQCGHLTLYSIIMPFEAFEMSHI